MSRTFPLAMQPEMSITDAFWSVFDDAAKRGIPAECIADAHEFFRRYLWIRDADDKLVKFEPKVIQRVYRQRKRAAVLAGKKPWYLVLKSRQVGITTEEQGESFHAMVTGRHMHILTMAHKTESTKSIFRMVNRFFRHMDKDVRPKRTDSLTELNFPEQDCLFQISTAGGDSPAHGLTLSRVHLSEAARYKISIPQMEDLMSGVMEAAANGEIVAETTAQGASGWFYERFIEAMEGRGVWTPIFLAWFDDPTNVVPLEPGEVIERTEEEMERSRLLGPWSDEQIKYRRAKQAINPRLFPQEFPETWEEAFLVQGDCWFDVSKVQSLIPRCAAAIAEYDNGHLQVWQEPVEGERYYIGADTAEGLQNGDADAAIVLDSSGVQCASLHGRWATDVYGHKLAALGRLYNTAVIAVEANNHGHSVLNTLRNAEQYPRLFVHRAYDADPAAKGKLGWQTTPKTRPVLLDKLRDEAIEGNGMRVNDRHLLNECLNFCLDSRGSKYEARPGRHDDRVMAAGIAWCVRELAPREARVWVL